MTTHEEPGLFRYTNAMMASVYWSETHLVWKWTVTRRSDDEWLLWDHGEEISFGSAQRSVQFALGELTTNQYSYEPF